MGISKQLLEEEHENFLDEYIYLQALYHEWEEQEYETLKQEEGRVHILLPKENLKNESVDQFKELPF